MAADEPRAARHQGSRHKYISPRKARKTRKKYQENREKWRRGS
jgi:hypothetical protein